MFFEHVPTEVILFFILYGITGVVPLVAAVYLLLGRSNVFAPDVTPPVRLRRWAASVFAASAVSHVWWYLFYMYSRDYYSVWYMLVVVFDFVGILTTIAATLLAMLQDRKRPIWPTFIAMVPFVVIMLLQHICSDDSFIQIGISYNLSLYVLFSAYMVFAVRRYGRWLNDNYADLENKNVWLSQAVSLAFLLLSIIYTVVDVHSKLLYFLHFVELLFYGLLLWRVETLPQLDSNLSPAPSPKEKGVFAVDLVKIERLLKEHCEDTQLYLQHDLSLQQLAQTVGTNRFYLSQYFSRHGITYNTYINNLRINHFINRYQELAVSRQPVVAQQLAQESGYRSYSTFGRAFMQRMGQSVTAWMRETGGVNADPACSRQFDDFDGD